MDIELNDNDIVPLMFDHSANTKTIELNDIKLDIHINNPNRNRDCWLDCAKLSLNWKTNNSIDINTVILELKFDYNNIIPFNLENYLKSINLAQYHTNRKGLIIESSSISNIQNILNDIDIKNFSRFSKTPEIPLTLTHFYKKCAISN